MNAYQVIKQKMGEHPMGVLDRPELDEILHLLYTPEQASVVQHLTFKAQEPEVIAAATGLPPARVVEMCETMADNGLVHGRRKEGVLSYTLLPIGPGILEYPLMRGPREGLDFERLRDLWMRYYDAGFGEHMGSITPSGTRVLPIDAALEDKGSVLIFEQVTDYVGVARSVAVGKCACRIMAHRCNAPVETCVYFDSYGEFLVERRLARPIDKAAAMDVFRRSEDAGLVHVGPNTDEGGKVICNCCSCCCIQLRARVAQTGFQPAAAYYCKVSEPDCIGCEACVGRCPTRSVSMAGDLAAIETATCIGCGQCASVCPTEAMKMVRRPDAIPPWKSMRDWARHARALRAQAVN